MFEHGKQNVKRRDYLLLKSAHIANASPHFGQKHHRSDRDVRSTDESRRGSESKEQDTVANIGKRIASDGTCGKRSIPLSDRRPILDATALSTEQEDRHNP